MAVSGCEMQSSLDLHLEGKIKMERDKLVCVMKLKHFPTASLEAGSVCSPRDLETVRRDQSPRENRPLDCGGRSFCGKNHLEEKSCPGFDLEFFPDALQLLAVPLAIQ